MGGSLLWVLFWLNTGSNPQTLTQTCTNFTKRNSIKHFITSNNFQKLTEWINGYRSWVVSRYNSRPRRPSVRQCCLRPGDQKSMENQKISKKKKRHRKSTICGIYFQNLLKKTQVHYFHPFQKRKSKELLAPVDDCGLSFLARKGRTSKGCKLDAFTYRVAAFRMGYIIQSKSVFFCWNDVGE